MINKKTAYIKIISLLLVMMLVAGCTALTRRDREPAPQDDTRQGQPLGTKKPSPRQDSGQQQAPKKPSLPKALQASQGQETSLKVFIKDENRVEEM